MTAAAKKEHITDAMAGAILQREPFGAAAGHPWVMGYPTKGGTYMIATAGRATDSGRPRDLVAIDPAGNVHQVWVAVNPDFIAELKELLS